MAALKELIKSRSTNETTDSIRITQTWWGPKVDLTAGADGWIYTGPPAVGDDIAIVGMTWSAFTTPTCIARSTTPRFTSARGYVVTVCEGRRTFV